MALSRKPPDHIGIGFAHPFKFVKGAFEIYDDAEGRRIRQRRYRFKFRGDAENVGSYSGGPPQCRQAVGGQANTDPNPRQFFVWDFGFGSV